MNLRQPLKKRLKNSGTRYALNFFAFSFHWISHKLGNENRVKNSPLSNRSEQNLSIDEIEVFRSINRTDFSKYGAMSVDGFRT